MPTPKLLGPILATAAFSVFDGGVQPVPFWLMAAAQASIGLFMGMQLDADRIRFFAGNGIPGDGAGRHSRNVFSRYEYGWECFDYPDLSAGASAGDKYRYPAAAGMVV